MAQEGLGGSRGRGGAPVYLQGALRERGRRGPAAPGQARLGSAALSAGLGRAGQGTAGQPLTAPRGLWRRGHSPGRAAPLPRAAVGPQPPRGSRSGSLRTAAAAASSAISTATAPEPVANKAAADWARERSLSQPMGRGGEGGRERAAPSSGALRPLGGLEKRPKCPVLPQIPCGDS